MYVTTLWMDMSAQRLGTVGVWIQHSYIPLEKKIETETTKILLSIWNS